MKIILRECEGYSNPDDYIECDNCNGYGSSLNESAPTCTKCAGKGVVLK